MEVAFSLGSNLGDRLRNLRNARDGIAAVAGIRLVAQSPVYETEPVEVREEHRARQFLNAVLVAECDLRIGELARAMRGIESELGRQRSEDRNAPRTIDIDLIYAGTRATAEGGLDLPHPRWSRRRFVVAPLADVRPDMRLPGEKRTVAEVLRGLPPEPTVRVLETEW